MNVECKSCRAKYVVPDDKVKGKKVRITCKRCSAAIIIDGTTLDQGAPKKARQGTIVGGLEAPSAVRPPAAAKPPEPWTVAVTEEDQREMTTPDVVDAFAKGVIDDETFIWREGMEDWLTAFEIPEIAKALQAKGIRPGDPTGAGLPDLGFDDNEATSVAKSPIRMPDSKSGTAQGAWREPAKWAGEGTTQAGDAPLFSDDDLPPNEMFDDVTVAMAAPKAQELLDATAGAADDQAEAPQAGASPLGADLAAPPPPGDAAADEAPPLPDEGAPPPAPNDNLFDEDEATVVADSSRFSLSPDESRSSRPAVGASADSEPPARVDSEPPPSEPARVRQDAGPGTDLFGEFDRAGSEAAMTESASRASSPDSRQVLTGARNESSVLFSLDALTKGHAPKPPSPNRDDKVTADMLLAPSPVRQDADDEPPPSIANLAAGGMFGASSATSTPDYTREAPPSEAPPPGSQQAMLDSLAAPPKSSSRTGLWLFLGVLVAAAVGGGIYFMGQRRALTSPELPEPMTTSAEPTAEVAETAPAATETAPTASAPASASASAAPSASAAASAPAEPTATAQGVGAPSPAPVQAPAPSPAPRVTKKEEPKKEEEKKPEEKETKAPPFNKSAAASALAAAAANAQGSCQAPPGRSGSGRVSVTFVNSGRATRTVVTGDLAGTTAGGCVARAFRSAKVPAFSGDAVRVTKSVSLK